MIKIKEDSYLFIVYKEFLNFFIVFRNELPHYIKSRRSIIIIAVFGVLNLFILLMFAAVKGEFFSDISGVEIAGIGDYFTPPEGQEAEWAVRLSMSVYFGFITMIIACYFGALFARDIQPGTLRLLCVTPISRNIHLLGRTASATITTYLFFFIGHGSFSTGIILLFSDSFLDFSAISMFTFLFLKLQIVQLITIYFGVCFGTLFGLITKKVGSTTILFIMISTILNFLPGLALFLPSNFQSLMHNTSLTFHLQAFINWFVSSELYTGVGAFSFPEGQWIISLAILVGLSSLLLLLALHYFQNMDLD